MRSSELAWTAWRRGCALALAALVLSGTAPSAAAKTLRIVTIESAPFGFQDRDGKPAGMMVEIGDLIAAEAGFTSTNQIVPYQRTVFAVGSGEADFVLRFGNPELSRVALQVAKVLTLPTIVVSQPSQPLQSLLDLRGKTVGTPRGGRFDHAFDSDPAILKYEVADYGKMLLMILNARLDAGIGSSVGIYYNAHLLGIPKEKLGKPLVLGTRDFELHLSRKHADAATVAALKGAVERLHKRNAIKNIVNKYLSTFDWELSTK